ncbi:class I SAM-dependent methyltransferase [Actinokineospora globicatena]|uniref:Methyltransferase n=2 Tax=Actinokineospora globicatena TaxID=103729 RepID=A0A9W6VBB6_9PSEU|nr:class I SAM-dependent methyltransferase [Actinokineospora globicatena]MCP2300617.1 Methyltransferase domain-containing protein [Actinokineospora globicatena]GLW81161.1 methyltransferase [Actinokineospora globicatena]GLW88354.1 methyltransferase [Actinokineospora globicatena]GLW92823.1 methyltransferase [Actinokineospora globicatena]
MDFDTAAMIRANEANWDARTPIHLASGFYDVAGRDPRAWFAEFEWSDLGELAGKDLVHLQCHIGAETIAFPPLGARVVGLDISAESVRAATALAESKGVAVEYVKSDVHTAVETLGASRFDVVYTGKGALCYVPDLDIWAGQVAGLLRPGGQLYLVEFHPLLNALSPVPPPDGSEELLLRHDYLSGRGAIERDGTRTYTDGPELPDARVSFEWQHGIGEVVTALVGAGLRITRLRETEQLPWPRWSTMTTAGGWFTLPESAPRIPLIYALQAVKP